MNNLSSHIEKAIYIWKCIFNEDIDFYVDLISRKFNSYLFPKLTDISDDDFISKAIEQKSLELKITKKKSLFYPYDKNKTIIENLESWSNDIRNNCKDKVCGDLKWENFTKDIQKQLWTTVGKTSIFDKDQILRFYDTKLSELYYHINKSILNAEYLILQNYSELLKDVETYYEASLDVDSSPTNIMPCFIRDFYIIVEYLKDLCWRIKNAIDEKNNRRIEIGTHPEEQADKFIKYLTIDNSSSKKSDCLLRYTLSVIEMTAIDHIYKATTDNISKLFTLWDRCDDKEINSISNPKEFRTIVEIVKAKTATLLYKLVVEIGDSETRKLLGFDDFVFFYFAGNKNSEESKELILKEKIKEGLNPFIKQKYNRHNKTTEEKHIYNIYNTNTCIPIPTNRKDIIDYNVWIKKGQNNYFVMSSIIEIIKTKKTDKESIQRITESVLKYIQDKQPDNLSPYFFLLSLDFITCSIENIDSENNELKTRLLDLMQQLLSKLKQYILSYENSMPLVFRPYFEHSFYTYKHDGIKKEFEYKDSLDQQMLNNYHCDSFNNCFFFCSYYCNPISIRRLKDAYEDKLLKYNYYSTDIATSFRTQAESIKTSISELKNNYEEKDRQIKEQKDEINKTRQSSIQTLGLFTGFLAFIVTSIGTFRVAGNLTEYIIYSLTYTLAIVLFAFLISNHNSKRYPEIEEPFSLFSVSKYIVYVIVLGLLILLSVYYYTSKNFSKPKEEISITIDNSSTPIKQSLQDINQNDSTMENSPIKPNNGKNSNDNNHTSIDNASQE